MTAAMSQRLTALLVTVFLASTAYANEAAEARGAELLLPFKKQLKSALLAGLGLVEDAPVRSTVGILIEELANRLAGVAVDPVIRPTVPVDAIL